MEHDQALTSMAAEKYILGELRDDEREQFEKHFFTCVECAQDVRDLSSVTEGARIVLSPSPRPQPSQQRASSTWLSAWRLPAWLLHPGTGLGWATALVLAMFAGYQTLQVQKQRPQALASFVLQPETRGEPTVIPAEKIGAFVLLEADLPGAEGKLAWDLRRADSKRVVVQDIAAAPPPGESFKVLLPASFLPPADYTLTVRPATASAEKTWLSRFRVTPILR